MRRLHDAYRYTTVYVTARPVRGDDDGRPDCVMNRGKVEQIGLAGRNLRPAALGIRRALHRRRATSSKARVSMRCACRLCGRAAALHRRGKSRPVRRRRCRSARMTSRISAEPQRQDENIVPATVVRQVFLGCSRDYMVEAKDGTQLRVVTAAGENIAQGSAVWLHLPPDRCRALSG